MLRKKNKEIVIYVYENVKNGKVYVGQTKDIKKRDYAHSKSNKNERGIDAAIRKHGRESFTLNVVQTVETNEQADEAETIWIAKMRDKLGRDNVYNLADGGRTTRGVKQTAESNRKRSESLSGEKNYFYGKKHSEETKQKLRDAALARPPISEETRKKISEACGGENHWMFGKSMPDETKKKLSEALSGEKHPYFGKKLTKEHSKNISLAKMGDKNPNFGKKDSEETRKKKSEAKSGENNYNAKLSNKNIKEIRELIIAGVKIKDIMIKFSVCETTVRNIKNGKNWKSVK